jgi:hypothetical protein
VVVSTIDRGRIVSRYITADPTTAGELARRHPEIITASARASRAEWLEVPAEWRDYAAQYGPDEALARAREAGGFGV